ncbi:hypothetical protein EVAR_98977_1 [Eumeta japonica]|uniref:Uncharacterized protein n=1 Tax=Eumeta variegata TaxID=151549 RepID=A0A4C1YRL3_EUMVA|nr:hypothetical protein EVAR_98977_1 [Eumeta japonica]
MVHSPLIASREKDKMTHGTEAQTTGRDLDERASVLQSVLETRRGHYARRRINKVRRRPAAARPWARPVACARRATAVDGHFDRASLKRIYERISVFEKGYGGPLAAGRARGRRAGGRPCDNGRRKRPSVTASLGALTAAIGAGATCARPAP